MKHIFDPKDLAKRISLDKISNNKFYEIGTIAKYGTHQR